MKVQSSLLNRSTHAAAEMPAAKRHAKETQPDPLNAG